MPGDARGGPVPAELKTLTRSQYARPGTVRAAWEAYNVADEVPKLLVRQMERDLDALDRGDPHTSGADRERVAKLLDDARAAADAKDTDRAAAVAARLTPAIGTP